MGRKDGINDRLMYQVTKDDFVFTGTNVEVCNFLGIDTYSLSRKCGKRDKKSGYELKKIGRLKQLYDVIDDDNNVIFSGTKNEIAEKFFVDDIYIQACCRKGIRFLRQYHVEKNSVKCFKI